MDNLAPAQLSADEIPDGFTAASAQSPAGGANSAAAMKKLQMEEQRKAVLEQALSQEALARLGRIKLVKPDKAKIVEQQIVSLAMQGKLLQFLDTSKVRRVGSNDLVPVNVCGMQQVKVLVLDESQALWESIRFRSE